MLMDQVDTLHVDRCWSQVLCCNIITHLYDLEVKVTGLEILCLSFGEICISDPKSICLEHVHVSS